MQLRRNETAVYALWQRFLGLIRRAIQWQRTFSVVSALGAFATLSSFMVAALSSATETSRAWNYALGILFGLLTVAPLIMGRRMPQWAGLVGIAVFAGWSVLLISTVGYGRSEIMPLLQVPVVALYLGWFYRPRVGRTAMVLYMLVIIGATAVRLRDLDPEDDIDTIVAVVYAIMIAAFCLETGSYRRRQADQRALRDPLTRVYNRRGLDELGKRLIEKALASGKPITLGTADFDDFKAVNDAGGHAAGDRALCVTSQGWVRGLGPNDLVARSGGDEFVLLIHEDRQHADQLLTRIRAEAEHSWSWGLAEAEPGDDLHSLMIRADAELYEMKRECQGRNKE